VRARGDQQPVMREEEEEEEEEEEVVGVGGEVGQGRGAAA
jgi:hypothetical protein